MQRLGFAEGSGTGSTHRRKKGISFKNDAGKKVRVNEFCNDLCPRSRLSGLVFGDDLLWEGSGPNRLLVHSQVEQLFVWMPHSSSLEIHRGLLSGPMPLHQKIART